MTTELPTLDRLRLEIISQLCISLQRQVWELTPQTRAHVFGESTRFIEAWHALATDLHASTVDAP